MPETFVVGYDDSAAAGRALDHAAALARHTGGRLVVVYVLEWSPYSFLTHQELEERHSRRRDELSRAESAVLGPVRERLEGAGIAVETRVNYGHTAETLIKIAKQVGAAQIIVGRDGAGGLAVRMFGSTAGTLVQASPLPCTIIP
ncbi:universal stress protein [Roseivivax sp. CAU 1761]